MPGTGVGRATNWELGTSVGWTAKGGPRTGEVLTKQGSGEALTNPGPELVLADLGIDKTSPNSVRGKTSDETLSRGVSLEPQCKNWRDVC